MKIPKIISTVIAVTYFIATPERNTGAIQMQRGIVIDTKLRHLDLFSGIGGFSLGMEATGGFETVAFCDIEEFPRKVLAKHWPHVKQYKDIKELTYDKIKEDGLGPIDIITCGYPCQPFSNAGKKQGEKDPRHLWPDCFRLIKECRPSWVCGENVSGHIKLGLDSVLSDLESEGYRTRTFSISASSVGANHKRERVWILAHSERNDDQQKIKGVDGEKKKISRKHRKEDSDARKSGGTGAVRRVSDEHVEDARQSIRGIESSRNKKSSRRGTFETAERTPNANKTTRSSKRAETVADATTHGSLDESKRDIESMEKKSKRKKERRNQSSIRSSTRGSAMADAVERNVETGRERQREIREGHQKERIPGDASSGSETVADAERIYAQGQYDGQGEEQPWRESWWAVEPDVGRVAHGIPGRVDRLKGLGNSLLPQIPFYIGLAILESMKNA